MNVIVANKYKDLINSSNIQIMKVATGIFKVAEIANIFNGMYYQKLIIDATAIDGFPKKEVLKDLASRFDTEKLILFLPPDSSPPTSFLSYLVSINIYNFTDNIKGVNQLVSKSNTFEDVKSYAERKEVVVNNNNNFDLENDYNNYDVRPIIGIKSVTNGILSTEYTYMLKKNLEKVYHKKVAALEIDKKDFLFLAEPDMYSVPKNKLGEFISEASNYDIILVDLAKSDNQDICSDVLYLIEPSLYRINELMFTNKKCFENLKGKKVILVNSLLENKDINIFAKEAGISIYFTIQPLNDRIVNPVLNDLLYKLGVVSNGNDLDNQKKGLFDFLK